MNRFLIAFGLALLSLFSTAPSHAFPDRPIRIIVHVTAGSGSDSATRFVAERLAKVLGQPVVVENRPGANGSIAVMAVKSAPADGYTILLTSISTLSVNPIVLKNLSYDPLKDFKPISGLVKMTSAIVVSPDSPYRTLEELVAAGHKNQSLQFGSYAPAYRLAVEWLGDISGMKLTDVPYKGAAQMLPDVIAGRLDFAIIDLGGIESLAKSGKIRLLAVSSDKRASQFMEVPTVAESGYPEYVNYPWTALHVRTETPDDITARLADAMQKVLAMPEVKEWAGNTPGTDLMPLGPAEMRAYHNAEMARFRRLATKIGMQPE